MLERLRFEEFKTPEVDIRTALTALLSRIESTVANSLPALQESAPKLRLRTRSVERLPWKLHASFRLPALHNYFTMVYSLFHALRTLRIHNAAGSQASAASAPTYECSNWDAH